METGRFEDLLPGELSVGEGCVVDGDEVGCYIIWSGKGQCRDWVVSGSVLQVRSLRRLVGK